MAAVARGGTVPGRRGKEAAVPISPDGPLSYGMQLPVQSQSAIYAEPWEAAATPADLVRVARAADRGASPTSPAATTSPSRDGSRRA